MNHSLDLERLATRVKKEEKEWLSDYMHETRSRSLGEAIGRLIDENELLKREIETLKMNASERKFQEEISEINKRSMVHSEILNHLIYSLRCDREESSVITTEKEKTNVLQVAEQNARMNYLNQYPPF